jgi:hypothetical protein
MLVSTAVERRIALIALAYLHIELIEFSRVVLYKLVFAQLFIKFSEVYGAQKSITVLTKGRF